MDRDECAALVAYVRGLAPPVSDEPVGLKESQQVKAGSTVFKAIGCATCHLPKLGDVEGTLQ